jgi:hypothetical protein
MEKKGIRVRDRELRVGGLETGLDGADSIADETEMNFWHKVIHLDCSRVLSVSPSSKNPTALRP